MADFDLDLLFMQHEDGYRVQVLRSPAGDGQSADFGWPLREFELENFALRATGDRARTRLAGNPLSTAPAKEIGGRLFSAVFSGEVGECLRRSAALADQAQSALRVWLRADQCPDLAGLPWELLYDRARDSFLALSAGTPVIRYVNQSSRDRPVTASLPLRVLVIRSEPVGLPHLNLAREWSLVSAELGGLVGEGLLAVTELSAPTLAELHRALEHGEFHVLYFMGHGEFEEGRGGSLLFTDADGYARAVTAEDLGVQLNDHRSLRLAVLNACEAGRTDPRNRFGGVADTLVRQGVPAVVAMQFPVSDEASIAFAPALYGALAKGRGVDAAVATARKRMRAGSSLEWATPVLYLRAGDTRLFDLSHATPAPRQAPAAAKAAQTGPAPGEAAAHAARGDALTRQGRYAEAESAYRQAITVAPQMASAHAGLGTALSGLRRFEQALSACQEAVRLDPAHAPAHAGMSVALNGLYRRGEAETAAWEAVRLDPAYAPGRHAAGLALLGRNQLPDAAAALHEAVRLDPAYPPARTTRSALLARQNRYQEAEAETREAIRLAPAFAHAHVHLASHLSRKKQYRQAEDEAREAIRLQPDLAPAHTHLGDLLRDMNRAQEAEASYRDAIRLDPAYAGAHNQFGVFLLGAGRLAEAEAAFREAARLDPALALSRRNLAVTLKKADRKQEAEAVYRDAIRAIPDDAKLRLLLASLLRDMNRPQEAEAVYRDAIRAIPSDALPHVGLGEMLWDKNLLQEAEASYRDAIRLDPASAIAHNQFGRLLLNTGRPTEAATEFRKTISLDPTHTGARNNLEAALQKSRNAESSLCASVKSP